MANYDPLNSAKNRGPTEYAGGPGTPQLKADGHVTLTPAEKRRMAQGVDMATANVMMDLPITDEHYAAVPVAEKRVAAILRDHTIGDVLA
jgi:hypothetical protein